MDLSAHTSLAGLAEAVEVAQTAASHVGCDLWVTGGLARDLWLEFGYGFDTGRRTEDADFGFECKDWKTFETLARKLGALGLKRNSRIQHRFRHSNGTDIDLIPFGGVERPDRTVGWPPEENPVMNLVGYKEVAGSTVEFTLPNEVKTDVVDLAALAVLKLLAWEDRRGGSAGDKDAHDFLVINRFYLNTQGDLLSIEEKEALLERHRFESDLASAELLGSRMAGFGSMAVRQQITDIFNCETDPDGPLRLARAMSRYETLAKLPVIQALQTGFNGVVRIGDDP